MGLGPKLGLGQVILDFFSVGLCYLFLLVMVLVRVAFITLIEQKILALIQLRVGPNYVGY